MIQVWRRRRTKMRSIPAPTNDEVFQTVLSVLQPLGSFGLHRRYTAMPQDLLPGDRHDWMANSSSKLSRRHSNTLQPSPGVRACRHSLTLAVMNPQHRFGRLKRKQSAHIANFVRRRRGNVFITVQCLYCELDWVNRWRAGRMDSNVVILGEVLSRCECWRSHSLRRTYWRDTASLFCL